MKKSIALIMLVALVFMWQSAFDPSKAQDGPGHTDTPLVNGLQITVMDTLRSFDTTVDQRLDYAVVTTNKPTSIWVPELPEYAYQVDLLDSHGKSMPKTELGKKAGSKFSELDPYRPKSGIKLLRSIALRPGAGFAPLFLFRTKDMFVMTEPGYYRLRVSFQFLVHDKIGTNDAFLP